MDDAARLATLARAAADRVSTGMTLGLGTGSTADAVLRELGARVASGLAIRGVPTSARTAQLAQELGIPTLDPNDVERLDLGIDGADEIAPGLGAIKGRGGALLHEKLVALACDDYLIVAAAEKLVPRLGVRTSLPVEVVPFGWRGTAARLERLGCLPALRVTADPAASGAAPTPYVSDGGHLILDCATGPIADPAKLAASVKATPGVVEHGLFLGIVQKALVVDADGRVRELTTATEFPLDWA